MKRDGQKVSVWQDTVTAGPLPDNTGTGYDVIVVGGGITGLSTALRLQENGRSCLLIEAHTIGFGTTGGTSAHLNTVLDTPYSDIIDIHGLEKAKTVLQSTRDAIAGIVANIERYQIDCDYTPCKGFMYGQTEEEVKQLEEIKESIRSVGIEVSDVASVPAPFAVAQAIQFEEQGRFHPTKYIMGLLQAYLALGGHVLERTVIEEAKQRDDGGLAVKASDGKTWTAQTVVYATHTPPGVQLMHFRLTPYRSYVQVFALENESDCPHDLIYDMEDPFHYFRSVWIDGKPYLMVGGQDHKTAHHDNEQYNFTELEAFVEQHYNVRQKMYEWSSQYYESQDYLPFIGYCPGRSHQRELVATGFGGNGMIFGTLSSIIVSDLVLHGTSRYEDIYSPSRIGPLSTLGDVLLENLDVAKRFVADRFQYEKIDGLAEVGRGEGKILKYEGDKIGVYKDDTGAVHAVDPVCRHAGCIVKWNNAERSWDCPCHGARYAPDGSLLNGPTVASLDKWSFDTDRS